MMKLLMVLACIRINDIDDVNVFGYVTVMIILLNGSNILIGDDVSSDILK